MKIEIIPVPEGVVSGIGYEWIIETNPKEIISLTRPQHGDYGSFWIKTYTHSTRNIKNQEKTDFFGTPWYTGELTKELDYEGLREMLESGEIEEETYNKLKESARKTPFTAWGICGS